MNEKKLYISSKHLQSCCAGERVDASAARREGLHVPGHQAPARDPPDHLHVHHDEVRDIERELETESVSNLNRTTYELNYKAFYLLYFVL